jgi:hypothetical protein
VCQTTSVAFSQHTSQQSDVAFVATRRSHLVVIYTSISVEATANNPQREEVFHDMSCFAVVRMTRWLRLYISPQ